MAKTTFTFSEFGEVIVPDEFVDNLPTHSLPVIKDDGTKPSEVLSIIRAGGAVVMVGDFVYIVGVLKYLDRNKDELVDPARFEDISQREVSHREVSHRIVANKFERSRFMENARRDALHRLLVVFRDDRLCKVRNGPQLIGFVDWLEGGSEGLREAGLYEAGLIVPVRKVLRVVNDIKRYREGVYIDALSELISVFPHVYPPLDRKVVDMLASNLEVGSNDRVLDVGAGSGVLAFIAAKMGSAKVIATDISSQAVKNIGFNADKLGLSHKVEVRGPAHLFEGVKGEKFEIILFNAPWVYGNPQSAYEGAIYDKDGALITEFFAGVKDHLVQSGSVYLQYGNTSELTGHGAIGNLERLIAQNGFMVACKWSESRLGRILGKWEKVYLYKIVRKK